MYDLLKDDLIGIATPQGQRRVSLPALLALLAKSDVERYTGLRPHQEDPWRVFLVQLAASILARFPKDPLPTNEYYWREGLLDLADGKATAWALLVEDPLKPAFMQHPWNVKEGKVEEEERKAFKPKAATPDELDVLVTAKNHDVKGARISPAAEEAWLYAVVAYQTLSGFLGAGNYGIVRMNGGFASRPILSLVSSLHPSLRFQEELTVAHAVRGDLLSAAFQYKARGVVLTWLTSWDRRGHQCLLSDLEPFFIEAARPLRLVTEDGVILALGATSQARQIGPKTLDNGDVGDPWIPLNLSDKKKGRSALTVSGSGFTPELLVSLLFEQGYALTPLQQARPSRGPSWFAGSVLVRGQGKTEGFHHFALPVPEKAKLRLIHTESRKQLGELAQTLLKDAAEVEKALRAALTTLAEGGPQSINFGADTIKAWAKAAAGAFSRGWEEAFFPTLWRWTEEEAEGLRAAWHGRLTEHAFQVLDEAQPRLPLPSNRRYRAVVRARGFLAGSLIKKGLLPKSSHVEPMEEKA